MIVVDTTVVAYLLIEGERTDEVRELWELDPDWRLPPLWRAELLNVLATSHRAGILTPDQARHVWRSAVELLRNGEVEPGGVEVLELAIARGITAYDAQFVCAARRMSVPLVSGDRRLCRACPDSTVSLDDIADLHGR
ncbi:MAG: type II toxin-antitoxin system VapC family toxin [Polyangia bacterium]